MYMDDDDDVYTYIHWRLKLEGGTENMGVCTKERKGVTADVLMAAIERENVVWYEKSAKRDKRER